MDRETEALHQAPFNMSFEWEGKKTTISLKDGEDTLKLADIYKNLLAGAGIEYVEKAEYFSEQEMRKHRE